MQPGEISQAVEARFTAIVGASHVITGSDMVTGASTDWLGRTMSAASAVLRPATTEEVAGLLEVCSAEGIAVVPQGGNTGLVGGGVPRQGEVVLSTTRLDSIIVDRSEALVTAGAGATLDGVQRAARSVEMRYPVDFGARASATVGGMIATNAGGISAFRHGMTRRQVLGLEFVLSDGTVVRRMRGLVKDNTGFDLTGLMCGSEGALGVVTAARLRLINEPTESATAWLTFADLSAAIAAGVALIRSTGDLEAVEFIDPECVALLRRRGHEVPVGDGAVLLVELSAREAASTLSDLVVGLDGLERTAVAPDARVARSLWAFRDAVPQVIRGVSVPAKFDVAVPVAELSDFLIELPALVASVAPEVTAWRFGHAADGNCHVNVTGVESAAEFQTLATAIEQAVVERGGTISAEHGVGSVKTVDLPMVRSERELELFAALKWVFDPSNTLNPGVIVAQPIH